MLPVSVVPAMPMTATIFDAFPRPPVFFSDLFHYALSLRISILLVQGWTGIRITPRAPIPSMAAALLME